MVSEARRAIRGGAFRMRNCPCLLMLRTLDETLRAVDGEVSAPRWRYGQLGALVRNPSPCWDIVQWCLPSRRQHAGRELCCACRNGNANPKHNSNSTKLAETRRINKRIVLRDTYHKMSAGPLPLAASRDLHGSRKLQSQAGDLVRYLIVLLAVAG